MAIYTTFFVATDDDLARAFPHWRTPLAQPVPIERRNPFTGAVSMAETWDPADVDPSLAGSTDAAPPPFPQMQVVAIEGSYEEYLEQRLHPSVRAAPHRCWKSVDPVKLTTLLLQSRGAPLEYDDARFTDALREIRPARIPPDDANASIEVIPEELVSQLITLGDAGLDALAERWSMTEECQMDGFDGATCRAILDDVCALAREAREGARVLVITEW